MFHVNNPTFFYDLDQAERKLELAKHLVEINNLAKKQNTRIDRLRHKHLNKKVKK